LGVEHEVPGQKNVTMRLKLKETAIAIQEGNALFFYPDMEELLEMKLKGDYTQSRRVMQKVSMDVCELAIIANNHTKVKEQCEYQVMINQRRSEMTWLGDHRILAQQVDKGRVTCPGNRVSSLLPCDICVISLSNRCEYQSVERE